MNKNNQQFGAEQQLHRRTFLGRTSLGLGALSLASLAGNLPAFGIEANTASSTPGIAPDVSGLPHFAPRIKRVIFLCMNGGPSHVDLFDYKPALNKGSGNATTVGRDRGGAKLLGSPFKFARHG